MFFSILFHIVDESLSQSQSQTQERDSPAYLLNSCDKPSRALPRRRYDDVDKSDILSLLDESLLDSPKSDLGIGKIAPRFLQY